MFSNFAVSWYILKSTRIGTLILKFVCIIILLFGAFVGNFDLDFGFSPAYKQKKRSELQTVRKASDSHLFFLIHTDHSKSPYAIYLLCVWR